MTLGLGSPPFAGSPCPSRYCSSSPHRLECSRRCPDCAPAPRGGTAPCNHCSAIVGSQCPAARRRAARTAAGARSRPLNGGARDGRPLDGRGQIRRHGVAVGWAAPTLRELGVDLQPQRVEERRELRLAEGAQRECDGLHGRYLVALWLLPQRAEERRLLAIDQVAHMHTSHVVGHPSCQPTSHGPCAVDDHQGDDSGLRGSPVGQRLGRLAAGARPEQQRRPSTLLLQAAGLDQVDAHLARRHEGSAIAARSTEQEQDARARADAQRGECGADAVRLGEPARCASRLRSHGPGFLQHAGGAGDLARIGWQHRCRARGHRVRVPASEGCLLGETPHHSTSTLRTFFQNTNF
eukprot:4094516-Prymnesium_polylepis.1